jgi:hypothetical protein
LAADSVANLTDIPAELKGRQFQKCLLNNNLPLFSERFLGYAQRNVSTDAPATGATDRGPICRDCVEK